MIDSRKKKRNLCIIESLKTIKSNQDFIIDPSLNSSKYRCEHVKIVDTIPFILWNDSGLLELTGFISDHLKYEKTDSFCTSFFRIEKNMWSKNLENDLSGFYIYPTKIF
jgi:hypothetical protein